MKKGFSDNTIIETNNTIREFETYDKRRTKSCKDISNFNLLTLVLLFNTFLFILLPPMK